MTDDGQSKFPPPRPPLRSLCAASPSHASTIDECKKCNAVVDRLLDRSPIVVFLRTALEMSGCDVPRHRFVCEPCGDQGVSGGYDRERAEVVVCSDKGLNKKYIEKVLAHELIHVFDDCRIHVDWGDLRHHACSEIRAANLSGDCHWKAEMLRGNFRVQGQHKECVRRRAILSVSMNKNCPDVAAATQSVDSVFRACFKDLSPFSDIP